jgi:hypothetical protein
VAEDVLGLQRGVPERDGGDQVDQLAELGLVDLQAAVLLVEHPFELGVVLFDRLQRIVDQPADAADGVGRFLAVLDNDLAAGRQLGMVLQRLPTRQLRHPEDVLLGVVVADLQLDGNLGLILSIRSVIAGVEVVVVGLVLKLRDQLLPADIESIGDILDEQQAQHRVLVLRRIESGAQLVGGIPEFLFQLLQKLLFRHSKLLCSK